MERWFYTPVWRQTPPPPRAAWPEAGHRWLLFGLDDGVGDTLAARLREQGGQVVAGAEQHRLVLQLHPGLAPLQHVLGHGPMRARRGQHATQLRSRHADQDLRRGLPVRSHHHAPLYRSADLCTDRCHFGTS